MKYISAYGSRAKYLLALIIIAAFCAVSAFGQSTFITTGIVVEHPDEKVAASMRAALTKEIGSLKNVILVKDKGNIEILVSMITIPDVKPVQYAVSNTIMQRRDCGGSEEEWVLITGNVSVVHPDKMKEFAENVAAKYKSELETLWPN